MFFSYLIFLIANVPAGRVMNSRLADISGGLHNGKIFFCNQLKLSLLRHPHDNYSSGFDFILYHKNLKSYIEHYKSNIE